MTIVCSGSHTSTHDAFGACAFGIGTSEVEHVMATQCLPQSKPRTLLISVRGALSEGVTAKDLALGIIGQIGTDGATGHVIEYAGAAVRALSVEGRMTLCNMSIDAGARAGMIAPDEAVVLSQAYVHAFDIPLEYIVLQPLMRIADLAIYRVFIGSCTKSRLEDLRSASRVINGRQVHNSVRAMVVPGSQNVKHAAEAEGL